MSVRRRSGYDSKPQIQNFTSLCALILFAAVNHAPFFGGSRIQQAITNREAPCPAWASTTRDELVSGVLQLLEPSEPNLQPSPEMVPYQPTPVRHVLHLIAAAAVTEDDVFVDLGSGLGHVPLLVSMVTGAQSLGVEVQAAYVASARRCAQSLRLSRVRFIAQDARDADLSRGTMFYLYSPFKGSILADVLSALRRESMRRPIKICSLGPCTRRVSNQTWLKASALPVTGSITVFDSL